MRQTTRGPKIFLSLLALCYLEIVLWTACLLFTAQGSALPGEALAGQVYLRRETSNLKTFAGGRDQPALLFDELALHLLLEHHQQLEHLSLKQQFNAQSDIASSLLLQPHAQSLRAFPAFQGLPAPFTGVQAID
ncbi:hypothetical protein COO60DRAFT_1297415 [Scenedesmus sp. NREL 46B-D3]|nr:hypothetical protein COO60DRAFT_1297415 [Scenedesmus sp. NREL 46B-D3]